MSVKKFKICDPLYDYIYLEEDEIKIINHFIFQRLRYLRQLGFSDQAFPSGTHNRYTHSLGVCHLAGQAFDSIFNKNKWSLSSKKIENFRKLVRVSALLHDVGHGPLSHSSECLMPSLSQLGLEKYLKDKTDRQARHEDYSLKFIMEKEGLYDILKENGIEPSAVAQLLHFDFSDETNFFSTEGLDFLPLLRQIISSEFDVDRMDYLYRDSLSCGVKYGLIDFAWLISHFDSYTHEGKVFLAIASEALYTLESLILGRQHMRLIVYFHHKSASYNQMLKNYSKNCNWRLPTDILEYARFTDSQLFEILRNDSKTNEWAKRIVEKNPYLRLYEAVYFKQNLKTRDDITFLKQKLENQNINFILIDSKKHSIKPSKSLPMSLTVYLKNKALNTFYNIEESLAFLNLPSRTLKRIYVCPEDFSKAKNVLKNIL
ncbi:MAG: HD domain-containing protein [Bdellovibrionaceae bacterium]|nr:HD domain-containing protein [Pseudobdellovibrionaceae bacterium]